MCISINLGVKNTRSFFKDLKRISGTASCHNYKPSSKGFFTSCSEKNIIPKSPRGRKLMTFFTSIFQSSHRFWTSGIKVSVKKHRDIHFLITYSTLAALFCPVSAYSEWRNTSSHQINMIFKIRWKVERCYMCGMVVQGFCCVCLV